MADQPPTPGGLIPKVSVLMSVRNGIPFLDEAVGSILAQSFADFEFLIVNDGSTDGSLDLLRRVAASDPRVRIINQRNTGLTAALIRAARDARGELIARMDADDICAPTRLEKQVAVLAARPELVAVACRCANINAAGRVLGIGASRMNEATIPFSQVFVNGLAHGAVMMRRSAYEEVGGYRSAVRYSQDYDLWSRLLRLGRIGYVEETLYTVRLTTDGISATKRTDQIRTARGISRDSISLLTGEQLDEELVGKLRRFFGHFDPATLRPADIGLVHRQVRRVGRACSARLDRRGRSAVRVLTASCWIDWFYRAHREPLVARVRLLWRALSARPGLALRSPAVLASRLRRPTSRRRRRVPSPP